MVEYFDRLMRRFRQLVQVPLNPSMAIIMAIYTFLWGVWIANPFWTVFPHAPLYSTLSAIMPEVYWGLIAIVCGWFMCWGIVRGSYESLTKGAFVGFVHWLIISAGYFAGDWHNTGGLTALMICIYCGVLYLNRRVNRDNLPLERNHVKI